MPGGRPCGTASVILLLALSSTYTVAFGQTTSRPAAPGKSNAAQSDSKVSEPYSRGLAYCILAEKNPAKPTEYDDQVSDLRKHGPIAPDGVSLSYRWFELGDPVAFLGINKSDGIRPDDLAKQRTLIQHHEGRYFVLGRIDPVHSLGMDTGPKGLSIADVRIESRPIHRRRTVTLQLDRIGSKRLETFTRSNRGRDIGVIVDGKAINHFTIEQPITGSFAIILPTPEEAERLVGRLKSDGNSSPPKQLPPEVAPAKVSFRILALPDPAKPNQFAPYTKRLAELGPKPSDDAQTFRWFPVYNPAAYFNEPKIDVEFDRKKSNWPMIAGRYRDRFFVLAHVDREHSMALGPADENGALRSVSIIKDVAGNPSLGLELDDRAAENLHQLTKNNIGRSLTILIDDEAVMSGALMDPLRESVIISGGFTRQRLEELQARLQAGVGTKERASNEKPTADRSKRAGKKGNG